MTSSRAHPGSHTSRILAALREYPVGASDAQLAHRLGVTHQTVNQVSRKLVARGLLLRERQGGTLINRLLSAESESMSISEGGHASMSLIPSSRPWYWEGNTQAKVVDFLVRDGWTIRRVVDTASRERGKDIESERDGTTLWVTVKGFPDPTAKTHPSVQAGHWFAGALFDVICWREEDPAARIAVALPMFERYQALRERTRWLESATPFGYLWVAETGDVLVNSGVHSEAGRQQ